MDLPVSQNDFNFISRLFARVGFWISRCEDTDKSRESETAEKEEMIRALKRVAKISCFPVVGGAAKEALNILNVPENDTPEILLDDIRHAVDIFKRIGEPEMFDNFSKALRYVGFSVARAYREELDHHQEEFLLESVLNKLCGELNEISDPDEFKDQNISPAENSALTQISEALRQ